MKILTVFSFVYVAALCSCKSSTTTSPELTGNLKGLVALFDTHGNQVADRSGVAVQVEGTSFSAISDIDGAWIIHDLPTRTYSISFSKPGYGTMKNTSFSFIGGGTVIYEATMNNPNGTPMYLAQPLTFTLTLDSVSAPGPNTRTGFIVGHLTGEDLADSNSIEVDVNIGTTIDSSQAGVVRFGASSNYKLTRMGSDLVFKISNLDGNGLQAKITSGEVLHFKARAFILSSLMNGGSYFDVVTGKYVAANNPPSSNILSSIVP